MLLENAKNTVRCDKEKEEEEAVGSDDDKEHPQCLVALKETNESIGKEHVDPNLTGQNQSYSGSEPKPLTRYRKPIDTISRMKRQKTNGGLPRTRGRQPRSASVEDTDRSYTNKPSETEISLKK